MPNDVEMMQAFIALLLACSIAMGLCVLAWRAQWAQIGSYDGSYDGEEK